MSVTSNLVPAGAIFPYAVSTPPKGWLLCDGTSYLRTDYPELYVAITTTFGSADGTHFNVPDFREAALVGVGTYSPQTGYNTTLHPTITSHDAYTMGQFKDDQAQSHTHVLDSSFPSGGTTNTLGTSFSVGSGNGTLVEGAAGSGRGILVKAPYVDGANGTPRAGTTSHGKQIGVNYIIKY